MFNATTARTRLADKVEELTDEFAALFADLPPRKQQVVIDKMNEMLSDNDSVDAFIAGNSAQPQNNSPAAALGTGGTTPPADPRQQLIEALNAAGMTKGQSQAVLRILSNPADPGHMKVQDDGTPVDLKAERDEVTKLTKERDDANSARAAAEQKLADMSDPNKDGSLARLLADAKANPMPAADAVAKADLKPIVKAAKTATAKLPPLMGAVKRDILKALDAMEAKVN